MIAFNLPGLRPPVLGRDMEAGTGSLVPCLSTTVEKRRGLTEKIISKFY